MHNLLQAFTTAIYIASASELAINLTIQNVIQSPEDFLKISRLPNIGATTKPIA